MNPPGVNREDFLFIAVGGDTDRREKWAFS
ncbi:hypothetical protein SAMN05216490_2481 [Mucilaginibacter mallensis]|uniref:Uncharacterized protein n=1 Tax=Mucilaginibacter mallensis TaxID=652787 RepID=A0A1H1XKT7_MUCMA|nr:hypothetical protein SAMN05216490_2481 [Mucilaginibacter mallensis]